MVAFVLRKEFEFETEVSVNVPGGTPAAFTARFVAVDQAVLDAAQDDKSLVQGVLRGWSGLKEEVAGGEIRDMAFTPDNVLRLLEIPYVRRALALSYGAAINGIARGN
jgi:hypothetical protein